MANNINAALNVANAAKIAVRKLNPVLAPTQAYATVVDWGIPKGKKAFVPRIVTVPAAVEDPANFETGDSTVEAVETSGVHLAVIGHARSADIQNGMRLDWLLPSMIGVFARAITNKLLALATVPNFGAAPVSLPGGTGFGAPEAATLIDSLRASGRALVLDSKPYGAFAPSLSRGPSGWMYPGFDGVHEISSGFAAGVIGFAGTPEAMVLGIGQPEIPIGAQRAGTALIETQTLSLQDLGISVTMCAWGNPQYRTGWLSLEAIVGAQVADSAALKVIASV